MIKIKNLYKSFQDELVLENVSFSIDEKGITAIKAVYGSGKTTLINILLGLIESDSGEIINLPSEISVVFQEDRLIECIKPSDNILLCNNDVKRIQAINFLENIGISDDKVVGELSGGMKRRVALARAMMHKAKFLILDEPFYGIDVENKQNIMKLIEEIAKEKSILLITHDERDIEYFGLNKKQIVGKFVISRADV
ncbi:MAG: ATP-binding cassette domain-containing protein [Clostridia bacterium]